MCGIAGKINWKEPVDQDIVVRMCARISHRGPDDSGIINLGNVILGHKRLSIMDLSTKAKQPMVSGDNRYFIVYNGEVYNFKELKEELQQSGVIFKTTSDTEVVMYAYVKWGVKSVEKFNGMFAFAIWDNLNKELFLARDRFGKKPLYYYLDHLKGIIFASELTAILEDKGVPTKISYEAVNCYLALGYILSPKTLYKDIFKLEPASYMLISDSGKNIRKVRYWNYAEKFNTKTAAKEPEIEENIISLFEASVRRRMISDVPVGAFLSGGIDSSSVAALAKRNHQGELHTFSMGFEHKNYSELSDAKRSAEWIGTVHHETICSVKNNLGLVNNAIDAYDEPFADNSLIPMYELAKFTSSYVKVVLSGDGADEMFAGYITYKADKYYNYARIMPKVIKRFLMHSMDFLPVSKYKKIDWRYKQKQFFYGSLYSPEKAHYLWRLMFTPEDRINILGEKYRELVYDTDPFFVFEKYYREASGLHWLDKNLYVDAMTWLPDDILVKVDRATMSHGIEARCPYLDVDFASYVASVPANLKLNKFNSKYILKKALKNILPEFILQKPKSGFNAPIGSWINTDGLDEFKAFTKYVFERKVTEYAAA